MDPNKPDALAVRRLLGAIKSEFLSRGDPDRVAIGAEIELPPETAGREVLSDVLMVALSRTRDRDVFEYLYRLNVDECTAYCAARLRRAPQTDVDDIVGDTFLKIFRYAGAFSPTSVGGFIAWMVVIAESQIKETQRLQKRSRRPEGAVPEFTGRGAEPPTEAIARELMDNVDATHSLLLALCAAGLLTLPPKWRTAIELREGEGMTYDEIAARMGVGRSAAGMMIRRARVRILGLVRKALSQYEDDR